MGKSSARCKILASLRRAFLVVSPASKLIIFCFDGEVRMVIISDAACFKKSSVVTLGIGVVAGKKVTVFTSFSALVFGKKHFMHQ